MPKISVVVPVYNVEKYLRRCLNSIISQTFKDWELILVDDESSDGSGAICDEYAKKDSRIRAFHKENGGVSSARQFGMDYATGDYTIHADPDDWVEPAMLEELYNKAQEDEADMVICDFFWDMSDGVSYSAQRPSNLNAESVFRDICDTKLHGSVCNKLIRTSVYKINNVRFQEEISLWEDVFFCLSVLRAQHNIKIAYLDKAFYHYFLGNGDSITHAAKYSPDYCVMILEKIDKVFQGDPLHKYAYTCFAAHLLRFVKTQHELLNLQYMKYWLPYLGRIVDRQLRSSIRHILSSSSRK